MYHSEYIKTCPECQQEYEARRLNQKFCSMKCKARYNNRKARKVVSAHAEVVGATNEILWRNRELLRFNVDKEISFSEMERVGFKRSYITRFNVKKKGKNQFFCYDYGYQFINEDTIKIFKS